MEGHIGKVLYIGVSNIELLKILGHVKQSSMTMVEIKLKTKAKILSRKNSILKFQDSECTTFNIILPFFYFFNHYPKNIVLYDSMI
jgi:hypothetical protein